MSRNERPYMQTLVRFEKESGRRILGTSFMILCLSGPVCAQVELYQYRLEESQDNDLCVHMTQVFNENFKTPWDRGNGALKSNPIVFDVPYDHMFERLPGVEYSKDFVFQMLLAKFPSSPEFDAVKWREGRVYYKDSLPLTYRQAGPMLVTEIDIDNDGTKEWVVKDAFMFKAPTSSVSKVGDSVFQAGMTLGFSLPTV